jgi:hypothetical protein
VRPGRQHPGRTGLDRTGRWGGSARCGRGVGPVGGRSRLVGPTRQPEYLANLARVAGRVWWGVGDTCPRPGFPGAGGDLPGGWFGSRVPRLAGGSRFRAGGWNARESPGPTLESLLCRRLCGAVRWSPACRAWRLSRRDLYLMMVAFGWRTPLPRRARCWRRASWSRRCRGGRRRPAGRRGRYVLSPGRRPRRRPHWWCGGTGSLRWPGRSAASRTGGGRPARRRTTAPVWHCGRTRLVGAGLPVLRPGSRGWGGLSPAGWSGRVISSTGAGGEALTTSGWW